jgi:hypothetical protein
MHRHRFLPVISSQSVCCGARPPYLFDLLEYYDREVGETIGQRISSWTMVKLVRKGSSRVMGVLIQSPPLASPEPNRRQLRDDKTSWGCWGCH